MAKSDLEKQLEKQARQAKQLADKQRREDEKRAREQRNQAAKDAIRQRASTIISSQPLLDGFRVMDTTAEEMLQCLLSCEIKPGNQVNFDDSIFPEYAQMSVSLELEKLLQYGMVAGIIDWMGGGMLNLLPPALTYFDDKEAAYVRQKEKDEQMQGGGFIYNTGNIVFGNVSGSYLTVDNSISQLEKEIENKGGEDKQELLELLSEVKELIENIETSRTIPKQKKLHEKLTDHMAKHGWFYGAVLQLLGTAALSML